LPAADASESGVNLSATTGRVALVNTSNTLPATGDAAHAEVVDFVGFGATAATWAGAGRAPAPSNTTSISRDAAHANTADNAADFTVGAPTPTPSSQTPPPPPGPVAATISEIQGTRTAPGLANGTAVVTSGVVTAAYPTGGLSGFVIQEPGTGGAIDLDTWQGSKAVFVYQPTTTYVTAVVGQHVKVTGAVARYQGLTEVSIAGPEAVEPIAEPAAPVAPITAGWPRDEASRQAIMSMLYQPTGAFTVTDNYTANTTSALGLAYGDSVLRNPTDLAPYADTAARQAIQADNAARAVALDDCASLTYTSAANVSLTPPYVSADYPIRVGAAATITKPVIVDVRQNKWTLNPTARIIGNARANLPATFANNRTAVPDAARIGAADIKVASFNVLNYFPTTGEQWVAEGRGACTDYKDIDGNRITVNTCANDGPRGAWDQANFLRQQTKIVEAISALGADVVGLMEIENSARLFPADPAKVDAATKTLVAALNAKAGADVWAHVPSSANLPPVMEMDVITCAMIYRRDRVEPLGASLALGTESGAGGAFANAREPIGQIFRHVAGGDPFLAVVNHFKSKSSGDAGDVDTGQGASNLARVAQARALANWVNDVVLPGANPPVRDAFLLGDFNAYTKEDPILELAAAGFEDVNSKLGGNVEYSYQYSGLNGSLDHVLANASAYNRITGQDTWNINSPESIAHEYSRYHYNAVDFYRPDAYRSSDHDPVVVGLKSTNPVTTVTLLNINDFHGRIDANTVKWAGTIERLRQSGGQANTALISAGDNIGASLFASAILNDTPTLNVLNALDTTASAVGNHEFDKGWADLRDRVRGEAGFPYLGANVYLKDTTTPALPEYQVVDVGGVRVGVIGTVTQETPTLVSPAGVTTLDFGDPVAATNRVAAKLTADDLADVIVAEYHEGSPAGTPDGASLATELAASPVFARIVNETSAAVDVIFTGHTHKVYAWDAPIPGAPGKTRPVVQTGSYGDNIGRTTLTVDKATDNVVTYASDIVPRIAEPSDAELAAAYPRVAAVKGIVDAALANAEAVGAQPVGKISADITRGFMGGAYDGPGGTYRGGASDNRAEASALGTLVGNALKASLSGLAEPADIGVVNPGGLRADLIHTGDGAITFADVQSILPFNNTLAVSTLTGAQVVTMLEQQWQRDAAGAIPSREYLQLGLSSNVSYTYQELPDPDHPATVKGQVTSVWINGELVEADQTYRIGTFSFLAAGGDNFRIFTDAVKTLDTGLLDWEGWVDYVTRSSTPTPLAPDFTRRGVEVKDLPAAVAPGGTLTFGVGRLDVPSLGSPANTSVSVKVAGQAVGTAAVAGGFASVSVTAPAALPAGSAVVEVTALPSGTVVRFPLAIAGPALADTALLQLAVDVYALYEAESARYTPESWAPLALALAQARALVALGAAPLADIEAAIQALRDAAEGLVAAVDPSALEALIARTRDVLAHPGDYVSAHQPALATALDAALAALANADLTQEQVVAAAIALATALAAVLPKGDKSGLRQLIALTEDLPSARYTPASWQPVASALAAAKTVEADAEASVDDVESATAQLTTALANLILTAAKAGLATAIAVAESIADNAALYYPASITGLAAALTAGRAARDNPNATTAQVADAQTALVLVVAGARLKPAGGVPSALSDGPLLPAGAAAKAALDPAAVAQFAAEAPAAPRAPKALKAAKPKIAGKAKAGQRLKAKAGAWPAGARLAYQWYRNGRAIAKATKASYKVKASDAGKRLRVKVTGTKAGYEPAAKTSAAKKARL
ncbi:MAG: ExeM/NucH family extracellular endonuclease, partial [Bifidobacteriaceae bacterium]|nr:ExeM/NucH family extracellular endonuclease [Bifidobacteriaceae bacterium]